MRQLFAFWQFNGDNRSWCNQTCPYCYGGQKEMRHYWNGDVLKWEKAWERLNRDIYFVMSYGESMGGRGFYECVDMIGEHPTWSLCIVTNLAYNPEQLINSQLGREGRVYVNPCWHPLGVPDRQVGWERFKNHVLMLKNAGIPTHALYLWYPGQIQWFPQYFSELDKHDVRFNVRRFVGNIGGIRLPKLGFVGGRNYPESYSPTELAYLEASTCPKVYEYGIKLASPKGKLCTASKDLVLVKHNGDMALCADCYNHVFGNLFQAGYNYLSDKPTHCPWHICGGDYGMLHMQDDKFGPLPDRLWNDTFLSQVEEVKQTSPVAYPKRDVMLEVLERMRHESTH